MPFLSYIFSHFVKLLSTGVYFEKILKKSNSNIWLRNIQLGKEQC